MGLKKLQGFFFFLQAGVGFCSVSSDLQTIAISQEEGRGVEIQGNHMQRTDGLLQKATAAARGYSLVVA